MSEIRFNSEYPLLCVVGCLLGHIGLDHLDRIQFGSGRIDFFSNLDLYLSKMRELVLENHYHVSPQQTIR